MHAAASGGRSPKSLADLSIVAVPLSRATGTALGYRVEGDQAILEVPRAPGRPVELGWRLRVRFK